MVIQIRQLEESLGSNEEPREISQGELMNREILAKSLIVNCDLKKGETIERLMIDIKSPGQGLQPNRLDEVVGKIAGHDFELCVSKAFKI
jgi:sialic acid synthase SpsE